jgi:uncharacterized protein YecE (DUF72 family)
MNLHLGTSGWGYDDWLGNFYPKGTKSKDYLEAYAARFKTVEIDSTFYAVPRESVVKGWYDRTPDKFIFAAKFPQSITHEKKLSEGIAEANAFCNVMKNLKEKLGPLLVQFPQSFRSTSQTMDELKHFLDKLPIAKFQIALEIRHVSWLHEKFFDMLADRNVVLALNDVPQLPRLSVQTGDFLYIRWLGDRAEIPAGHTHIQKDRTQDLTEWKRIITSLGVEQVFGYFNNHYAGHSPSSVEEFSRLMQD